MLKKENTMNWILDRLKEKASHGGLGLVAVGLIILFAGGLVDVAAYLAIIGGIWQIVTKD